MLGIGNRIIGCRRQRQGGGIQGEGAGSRARGQDTEDRILDTGPRGRGQGGGDRGQCIRGRILEARHRRQDTGNWEQWV